MVVDSGGNAYVAGSDTYDCFSEGPFLTCVNGLLLVKYNRSGTQVWKALVPMSVVPPVQVVGLALDDASNINVLENAYNQPWSTYSCSSDGAEIWAAFDPTGNGGSKAYGLAVDSLGYTVETGANAHYYPNTPFPIGTYKIGTNGAYLWANLYYSIPVAASVGTAIAVDKNNNCYVTGYSPATNGTNDIVTIKYDPNGNQVWLQRYSSPSGGNAAGNAIAVDNNGNVYVTGYDTAAQGGTEIVTIKYSPITLQRQPNGTVLLQAQGYPGEAFDIEASADLLNWLDLGTVAADTNGLLQFDDTNAAAFPARFYYATPQ